MFSELKHTDWEPHEYRANLSETIQHFQTDVIGWRHKNMNEKINIRRNIQAAAADIVATVSQRRNGPEPRKQFNFHSNRISQTNFVSSSMPDNKNAAKVNWLLVSYYVTEYKSTFKRPLCKNNSSVSSCSLQPPAAIWQERRTGSGKCKSPPLKQHTQQQRVCVAGLRKHSIYTYSDSFFFFSVWNLSFQFHSQVWQQIKTAG